MVSERPLDRSSKGLAEDLRKQVIQLLQADGKAARSNILVLPQVFLEFLNYDHKMALFLNQLLFWTERSTHPQKWVYKTYQDWYDELGFKESVIRRLIYGDASSKTRKQTLSDIGVEVRVRRAPNGSPTCHYRLDLDVFLDAIRQFGEEKQLASSSVEPAEPTGWNSANPDDGSGDSPALDPVESAGTLDQKTTAQISSENLFIESSNAPDDDEFQIFSPFRKRFGKLKDAQRKPFRAELERLGTSRVEEILERCATRGRSWSYVLKALSNETAPEISAQIVTGERWGGLVAFSDLKVSDAPDRPQEALLPVSEHINGDWQRWGDVKSTVQEVWNAGFHQLEMQLDRASFATALQGATLVDFDAETATFVVVARTSYARDLLQYRLQRTMLRVLGDVFGQPVRLQVLLEEEWLARIAPVILDEGIA